MIKLKPVRASVALVVVLSVALGALLKLGYGTVCSFRFWGISTCCPLGFLQLALAGRGFAPQLLVPAGVTLLAAILLGRLFCGWTCPTTLLRAIFERKGPAGSGGGSRASPAAAEGVSPASAGRGRAQPAASEPARWLACSRYAVLGGALLSSFLFRFPVFCLVCPVGLFFGALFAVWRLLFRQEPSLELLLYPAILGIELTILRDWCRSLCPLGAVLGLVGSFSRLGRPLVDKDRCLAARGIGCRVCRRACPQGVDLVEPGQGAAEWDCTRCLECYQRCPTRAIGIWPFRAPRGDSRSARRGAEATPAKHEPSPPG